jgi:hypothetical protein
VKKDHGVHVFDLSELDGYFGEAGFEGFRTSHEYGSVLVFTARKTKLKGSNPNRSGD